jgi:hypothetical protein
MRNMQNAVSMNDLMVAIQTISQQVGGLDSKFTAKFEQIDKRFEIIESDIAEIHEALQLFSTATDAQFKAIDEKFTLFDYRIMRLESQMVTKDYLDEKLADLRGDMIQRIRTGFPKLAV